MTLPASSRTTIDVNDGKSGRDGRQRRSWTSTVLLFFLCPVLISLSLSMSLRSITSNVDASIATLVSRHHSPSRLIWVIAHPDDESLFFSSTLLNLLKDGTRIGHILSLSNGDGDGLGEIREQELKASCGDFNISLEHCIAIHDSMLPDSQKVWWSETAIQNVVAEYVEKWDIDLIITFDDYGISGHANHRAISTALSYVIPRQVRRQCLRLTSFS